MPKSSSSSSDSSSESSSTSGSTSRSSSSSSSSGSSRSSSSSSSSSSSRGNNAAGKRRPTNADSTKRSKSRSASPTRKRSSPVKSSKVHIGRITRNVTRDHVIEIFSVYGAIKHTDVPMDRMHPTINRGFCYVEYEKPEDAEKACKYMNEAQIDGQEVYVTLVHAPSKPARYPSRPSPPRRSRYARRSVERRRRRSNERSDRRSPRRSRSPRGGSRTRGRPRRSVSSSSSD